MPVFKFWTFKFKLKPGQKKTDFPHIGHITARSVRCSNLEQFVRVLMIAKQGLRLASIAVISTATCFGFSSVPVNFQSRSGLLRSYCAHGQVSQATNGDKWQDASLHALVSRRSLLPLVLAPFLPQPAFAGGDDLYFKDELVGSDGQF